MKLLQTNNSTLQSVASNGNIDLGSITRSVCSNNIFSLGTNAINILQSGYYEINVNFIGTDSSEPTLDVGVYQNETLVALIQETLPATTDVATLGTSVIVRVLPNCCVVSTNIPSVITFRNTGASAISINVINVIVKKVA